MEPLEILYPPEILCKSTDDRVAYFRNEVRIEHPILIQVCDELLWAILDSSPGSLILLFGATGVGKTTLLTLIEEALVKLFIKDLEKDLGRLPSVRIHLQNPSSHNFDWKQYFRQLMEIVCEPLIEHKDDEHRWNMLRKNYQELTANYRSSGSKYRSAAERMFLQRKPLAILVDDAQHFGVVSSGRRLLDQLNTIKSVADQTHVTHVLAGTFELLPFRNLNGQLSRRSIDIHFKRYQADDDEQRQFFINALGTFQMHLPVKNTPDLVSNWDYFYERSLGCIGILKDWLTRSLSLALRDGKETLTLNHIERRALSIAQCAEILSEIMGGEQELLEDEDKRLLLRSRMKLDTPLTDKGRALTNEETRVVKRKKSNKGRNQVGRRKPVRDKIGRNVA